MGPRGGLGRLGERKYRMSDTDPGSSNPFSRHRVASTGRMRFAGLSHIEASNRWADLLDALSPRARKHRTLYVSDRHYSACGLAVCAVCAHSTV